MGQEFGPYLPSVIPSLFQMATLSPEMSISGSGVTGDIVDVLSEVKPDDDKTSRINVNTDEMEEKDVAI
jgi:hypothetical protein